jgi:hypothetical protein
MFGRVAGLLTLCGENEVVSILISTTNRDLWDRLDAGLRSLTMGAKNIR